MTINTLDTGHRKRLKERFSKTKGQGFADYEVLELILFLALPRIDIKPLAKKLLKRFGSVSEILNAPEHLLREIKGIGPQAVHVLNLFHFASAFMLKENFDRGPILKNWKILVDYCKATMGFENKEILRILFLNKKGELISDEIQQTGTIDEIPVYAREIFKRALSLQAAGLILVHNHTSGEATPSTQDILITRNLITLGQELGVEICDHIIVGQKDYFSFKQTGLM